MTLNELVREVGEQFGFTDHTINEAVIFADITMAPEASQKAHTHELTEEEVTFYRNYITEILTTALNDPEFRKEFLQFCRDKYGF